MSVTIMVDDTTDPRELAAIACLIAVLRGSDDLPAPPRVLFDYSDNPLAERPAAPVPPAAEAAPVPPAPPAADAPPAPAADVPPAPAAADAPPPPASEQLLQQEAARAAGTAGDRDVNGITWDERIHAGTKAKNADGSWRNKRGADPALIASVTAELKAAGAAQPPAADAPPPPAGDAPPPPSEPAPATVADAVTAFGAAGAGGASDADAPPPPAAAGELTYPAVLSRANEAGLDYDTLNAMAVDMGLEKFASLAKAPATTLRLFADTMEAKIAEGPATPAV